MHTLREKLADPNRFLTGVELVSTRGTMEDRQAIHTRDFAASLVDLPQIDWVSITDNAGGNPQLSPMALGKPILYSGKDKEVLIHLSCKDFNRNGLESRRLGTIQRRLPQYPRPLRRLSSRRLSRPRQTGFRHRFRRPLDDAR